MASTIYANGGKQPSSSAASHRPKPLHGELVAIADLKPYARNARTHSADQIEVLAASIREFGWTNPVLADPKLNVIAGHGRIEAAKLLGWTEVPVIKLKGLSKAQVRALVIADNQTALRSSWDDSLLKLELEALKLEGFDLAPLGFDLAELDLRLGVAAPESGPSGPGLNERFGVAPFSVLNAREGWWQDRKRAWLALGIKSEVGRGENLLKFSDTINEPDPAKRAKAKESTLGDSAQNQGAILGRTGKYAGAKHKSTPPHGPNVKRGADGKLIYGAAQGSRAWTGKRGASA